MRALRLRHRSWVFRRCKIIVLRTFKNIAITITLKLCNFEKNKKNQSYLLENIDGQSTDYGQIRLCHRCRFPINKNVQTNILVRNMKKKCAVLRCMCIQLAAYLEPNRGARRVIKIVIRHKISRGFFLCHEIIKVFFIIIFLSVSIKKKKKKYFKGIHYKYFTQNV